MKEPPEFFGKGVLPMIMAFEELTPLAWGLMGTAVLFLIQLLLCFRAHSRVLRGLPW